MKLMTTIQPMTDGTVVLESDGGKNKWVFKADEAGNLVADVDDEDMVGRALATGNFEPVEPADFDSAQVLLNKANPAANDADDDAGDGDEQADPNAPPVESNTPPKAGKPGRPPKAGKPTSALAA